MEYVVLDLEWNQCAAGKEGGKKEFPFEIIEIGAVKVDEENRILDEFHEYVRPVVYQELHHKTKELLQIEESVLREADAFEQVAKRFFTWCGKDIYFCTWGTMDLLEFQRNLDYFGQDGLLKGPLKYYDIQKLFALQYEGKRQAHTLEYAVDFLHLEKTETFHSAINDARYTAQIFVTLDDKVRKNYSIDCYDNPKKKGEEIYVVYDQYAKYISWEFDSKEKAVENRELRSTFCYLCGKKAPRKIKWFTSNSKNYYCLAYCSVHGYMKGKLSLKKTSENKVYGIKVLKLVDEVEAREVRERYKEVKARKKKKRIQKKGR